MTRAVESRDAWQAATLSLALCVPALVRADAGGLTLERVVQLAGERGEAPRAALARARAADARIDKARSYFLPDVTLRGTYTRRAFEGPTDPTTGAPSRRFDALGSSAELDITLFNASSFPLYESAQLDHEAAELRARDAVRNAQFDAALTFLTVLGTEQVVAAAERRVEFARSSVGEARARLAAGLASSNDATRAELELASAERDLSRARGEVESARMSLGHLVGEPVDGLLVPPAMLLGEARLPPAPPPELATQVRRRLDVAAAEKSAEALEASSDEPLLRTVPTLSLKGTARAANESVVAGHRIDGTIALTLTWILYDGGERYADSDERHALAEAGSLDAAGLARLAELETHSAFSTLRTEQAAAVQAELAVKAAEQNSRETGELYKSGLATALALADAGVQLFAAEVDLSRARYGVARALLEARRAAGLDPFGKEVR